MLIQLLAWLATALGLVSTWLVGRKHRAGWTLGIACCIVWALVNFEIRLWPGAASSLIALALAARNWHAWRPKHWAAIGEQGPELVHLRRTTNVEKG